LNVAPAIERRETCALLAQIMTDDRQQARGVMLSDSSALRLTALLMRHVPQLARGVLGSAPLGPIVFLYL
jgi:hypothetical protein